MFKNLASYLIVYGEVIYWKGALLNKKVVCGGEDFYFPNTFGKLISLLGVWVRTSE